jgi:hypothetical protein
MLLHVQICLGSGWGHNAAFGSSRVCSGLGKAQPRLGDAGNTDRQQGSKPLFCRSIDYYDITGYHDQLVRVSEVRHCYNMLVSAYFRDVLVEICIVGILRLLRYNLLGLNQFA